MAEASVGRCSHGQIVLLRLLLVRSKPATPTFFLRRGQLRRGCDGDIFTPAGHLPTPGQRGHSPQRHTAAGTAAPTTKDTGNTVPQRARPTKTAYARSRKRAQAQGQRFGTWTLVRPPKDPMRV